MKEVEIHNIDIEELSQKINEVRDVLNEVCCTLDENQNNEDVLKVSEYLDQLLVEYMRQVKNKENG